MHDWKIALWLSAGKEISGIIDRFGVVSDRLGHSLIDRFIEPGQIRQIGAFEAIV
jgi:hypothetical protein